MDDSKAEGRAHYVLTAKYEDLTPLERIVYHLSLIHI